MSKALHPILAQMKPSLEQIQPILVRDSDIVVTASAGAGKTRTLVARYLSLLADRLPPRSIVAITFTRKAAREMRNRIRGAVRRYLRESNVPDSERSYWRAVYARLDAARIGTIHSLCGEILRHHPAEMSLDPRFEVLDEGQMALLRAQAVDAALGWAAEDAEAARLFEAFEERRLRRIVARLLARRLDVEEAKALVGDDLWSTWEATLVAPIAAFIDEPAVQLGFRDLSTLQTNGTLARAEKAGDALAPHLSRTLEHWHAIRSARETADWYTISRHLAPLRDALKQKGRQANWAPARPKTTIARLQDEYDELVKPMAKKGIDLGLDHHLACDIVPALIRLYERALSHYRRRRGQRAGLPSHRSGPLQALDFDDLEAGALQLLHDHPAARAYWQAQIQSLLVDEFQDTNGRQRDLLRILNGGGNKLFIVGDAKQSIYRFRGADVVVFRQEQEAIAARGQDFELATSYRAHRALIQILNALLEPVLGASDPKRPYITPFAPLKHHRDKPRSGLKPPYLSFHLAVGSKTDGALERAACVLAARLADLVENGDKPTAVEDTREGESETGPVRYSDIAILCRASSSFTAYENALEAAGIPYLTVAGRGFYDRPEVRDVLNALQALNDPTDDLAMAGLLRSSGVGLSDMALYRLRQVQRSSGLPSLWALLSQRSLAFLQEESQPAGRARHLIERLHGLVGRTSVADVLKAFLDATGYRASLLQAGQARAVNNLGKLLADAQASQIVSVGAFVEYVAELRDAGPREGEARAIAIGAVKIMTVHQAKGLEFPVVVIGDAARRAPRRRTVLIDEQLGVVPPLTDERLVRSTEGIRTVKQVTSAAHRLAQKRDWEREQAESKRLLYVAATRARELLLVSGTVRAYKSGGIGTYGWLRWLDAALDLNRHAPDCDAAGSATHRYTINVQDQAVSCTIYEPEADVPVPTVAEPAHCPAAMPEDMDLIESIPVSPMLVDASVEDAERDPPRRVWNVVPRAKRAWAPSWVVGQLVHRALAQWLFPGAAGGFYAWAGAEARSCGLTDEEQVHNAVRRAAGMMRRFRASSLCREMETASPRLHEVPYSVTSPDGVIESGVIDALFHNDHGWTLVEFKTDRVTGRRHLEAIFTEKDYIGQVGRYLIAVQRLLGHRPQPVLCFLNVDGGIRQIRDLWEASV